MLHVVTVQRYYSLVVYCLSVSVLLAVTAQKDYSTVV